MENPGAVYLVGAGPGDPELVTLKGIERLKRCDTVVYDSLSSDRLLEYVPEACEKIYVGKRAGCHSMKQEEINRILVEKAREGHTVVRLKGGDPFVFGRGGEEVDALSKAGIPYEIVPGVTSAVAALSSAGIPATHRAVSRSFHVMTGHTLALESGEGCVLPPDFEAFAKLSGTLIFLMGLGSLPAIAKGLLKSGKSKTTPAAVIENGTLPEQRAVRGTLDTIVDEAVKAQIGTPAIIVVGEVAALHMESTLKKPLKGVRVGVTGTPNFTSGLIKLLEENGANAECVCGLSMKSYVDSDRMRQAYEELDKYTWIAFTSANAVRLFIGGLLQNNRDYRALGNLHFATVGKGTARELRQYGFQSDYTPDRYTVQDLADGLTGFLSTNDRILIPRSSGGSPELTWVLDSRGILYDDLILYDVVSVKNSPEDLPEQLSDLDYLTFASASGVEAFFEDLTSTGREALSRLKVVCIGDITAKALKEHGRESDVTADEFSIPGMLEAICRDRKQKETEV